MNDCGIVTTSNNFYFTLNRCSYKNIDEKMSAALNLKHAEVNKTEKKNLI